MIGPAGSPAEARREWRQSYPQVLIGTWGMASQSIGFMALGTLLGSIIADTRWSRTEVVSVGAFVAVLCLVLGPVVGRFLDRYGARGLALIGAALYPVTLASVALAGPSVWSWWALWIGAGTAVQLINPLVWSYAIAQRFFVNRGMAMGVALSGTGLANAIVPLLAINLMNIMGWRSVFVVLALLIFCTLLPLVYFFFKDLPKPDAQAAAETAVEGMSAGEAYRTTKYWRLCLAVLIVAATVGMINLHLQPILIDAGALPYAAAAIATLYGPAQIAGRLMGGYLLDHIHGAVLGCVLFLAPIVSLVLLMNGVSAGFLALLIPVFAGVAAGVEIDVAAYLASRYFGTRNFGSIFSIIYGCYAVGYSVSPMIGAFGRDVAGSYNPILLIMACLLPVAALLVATLGRYPDTLVAAARPALNAP